MSLINDQDINSHFASFRRYAFRLETLDSYSVPEHDPEFRAYLSGEPLPPDRDSGWFDLVRSARADGRFFRRIHLLPEVLSDYLRYEFEWGYCYTATAGEEIRLLPWSTPDLAAVKNSLTDFWLFDDSQLIFMRYEKSGRLVARELIDSVDVVKEYTALMEKLWVLAVPFKKYLAQVRSGTIRKG